MTFIPSEPGLYPGISRRQYEAVDAVNQSLLKILSDKTPAHFKEEMDHPSESSEAQAFGAAWHAAILEPDRFEAEYAGLVEKVDRRTKEGKAAWAAFEAEHAGKVLVAPGQMPVLKAMREAVWSRKDCRQVLRGNGKPIYEVCVVWKDADTDILCKALIDALVPEAWNGWTAMVDLKSTTDASFMGFRDSVTRYGYDYQAAFYLDGLFTLSPSPRLPLILAQEKSRPYCPNIHELDEADLDHGRAEYKRNLVTLARCMDRNEWPGYEQGPTPCPVKPWRRHDRELRDALLGDHKRATEMLKREREARQSEDDGGEAHE